MSRYHLDPNVSLKDIDIPVGTFHYVGNLQEVKPKGKPKADLFKMIEDQDPNELANEMIRVKKRKMDDQLPKKKLKQAAMRKKDSIESSRASLIAESDVTNSPSFHKGLDGDDEIDWSDCDELEMSRNIILFETSLNQIATPDISPIKKSKVGDSSKIIPAGFLQEEDTTDWSDCDELEMSRNISLLEQSINVTSASLQDRSALQEISNLSGKD